MTNFMLRDGTVLGDRSEGLTYDEALILASDFKDLLVSQCSAGIFEYRIQQGDSINDALASALEAALGLPPRSNEMKNYQVGVIPDNPYYMEPGPYTYNDSEHPYARENKALSDLDCGVAVFLMGAISGVLVTVGVQWACGVFGR